jgi:hypothetical protein
VAIEGFRGSGFRVQGSGVQRFWGSAVPGFKWFCDLFPSQNLLNLMNP